MELEKIWCGADCICGSENLDACEEDGRVTEYPPGCWWHYFVRCNDCGRLYQNDPPESDKPDAWYGGDFTYSVRAWIIR